MRLLPPAIALLLALPAIGQAELPPGHPPLDGTAAPEPAAPLPLGHPPIDGTAPPGPTAPLPPGHPSIAGDDMDEKKLLEKLDAMRDELKDRPKTAEIEYALGNLYYENARYPDAIDYYRQLLDRTAAPLQRYLAARGHPHQAQTPAQAGCPSAGKPTFEQLIAIADAKAAARDYSAAVTCYESALLPVIVAKARRANAFFLIGNPDRALQEHREVLAVEPDFDDSLFFLGAILFETAEGDIGKLTQAREAWKRYLALGPEAERAKLVNENLRKLDRALANGGQPPLEPEPEEAAPRAPLGIGPIQPPAAEPELSPQEARELQRAVEEGDRATKKQDWPHALQAYGRARKLDPANPKAATGAGIALLNQGQRAEAETAFRDALGRDPQDGLALYELGEVFFENRHYAGAVRFWSELLARDPKTAEQHGVKARLAEAQSKAR